LSGFDYGAAQGFTLLCGEFPIYSPEYIACIVKQIKLDVFLIADIKGLVKSAFV
jgi:hypothetical protein